MSEKTARAMRKIEDREIVSRLTAEKNALSALVNERTRMLNRTGDGLRALARKIVSARQEVAPLRYAVDQEPYLRGQFRVSLFEEAFEIVTGIKRGSDKFESVIKGAK